MGFWSWLTGAPNHEGVTANSNPAGDPPTVGGGDYTPGDPDGIELEGEETFSRGFPLVQPSAWDGWPADWSTPNWQGGISKLADTAWDALDLNASVLSTMPLYRLQSGRIQSQLSWMLNPDPDMYSSWEEFAKQFFWDYQMGEAFVLPSDFYSNNRPATFRVIPPWLVSVEMGGAGREYRIGSIDVTEDILHIRYKSDTINPRGCGPLEVAGARLVASGVLSRYMAELAKTGGVTKEWMTTDKPLTKPQSDELAEQWLESKQRSMGLAGVFGHGADLKQANTMSAKDMALIELAQFTESRIAVKCGVPPHLLGLPSGDSMTYDNASQLFDFHHRASLNPKATTAMSALSYWALPRGQKVELNRDEYTRPPLKERAESYEKLWKVGAISAEEIRAMERLSGDAPMRAPEALTGGDE